MKRLVFALAILMTTVLVLVGCGTATSTPSSTTSAITPPPSTSASQPTSSTVLPSATTTTASPTASGGPQSGGTLRWITATPPGTPIGWPPESSGINAGNQEFVLDSLLIEDINGNMVPSLATSYDLNSDPANPSVTFHLRQGVKFQDGTDFNAQAVKWDFEQVKAAPMNAGTTRVWKSIDVLDDYTIRVNYTTWQNQLLRSYNTSATMIFSPTAYQNNGVDWMRWHMVGTGPFAQKGDYQTDETLVGTRNPYYWQPGKPYLDGVQYLYVQDAMTEMALFKSGGGDVIEVNPKDAAELKSDGYQVLSRLRNTNMLLPDSMNSDSPWSNLLVREAAEYAIDEQAIAKTFGYGLYQPAYQVAPPNSAAYVPTITGRQYDPAKAKQLLAEAGYPNGFKTRIICGTVNQDINAAYQGYLAAVGINAELDIAAPARAQQLMAGGTWNNALLNSGVVLYSNFNNVLGFWFAEPSIFFKSVKKPDGWAALLSASLNSPKPDPTLMQKCVQALYDDATVITTVYDTANWAMTDKVHDTGIGQWGGFTMWSPQNAWLSK